ncbi:unnamed protein product [Rotaria sordida]|uniref:HAT C-terminal dimerisation domain-containing protein n=2 Tax=Rotaria sordida TaxID=392033 RepID=A0A815S5B2_9BILA|nr:unnamed protein product [Rotaria sordida]
MSNSASSSTTLNCSDLQNNMKETKQSVVKKFFINVEAKKSNLWHGTCSICLQDVTDTYGTTSSFVRHMKNVRLITNNATNNIKAFNDIVPPGFEIYFEDNDHVDASNSNSLKDDNDGLEEIFHVGSNDYFELTPLTDDIIQSEKNKETFDEFMTLLYLFNEATVLTPGDQTASISMVGPILLYLLSDLKLEKKFERTSLLCDALICSLKTCFGGFCQHFPISTDNLTVKITENTNTSSLYADPIFLMSPIVDGRFKFQSINDCILLSNYTKTNIISTIKQYIIDVSIKLNSKSTNNDVEVQLIFNEASNNHTDTIFTGKDNKKYLFPTLKFGSFEKTKIDNSTPKSISSEIHSFMQEENLTSDFFFKKINLYRSLNKLARKILCISAISAPIEGVFSQSGLLMRPNRSSFIESNVCLLTSLKCNRSLI